MAYSNEMYNKAKRILEKRHDSAVMDADMRSMQIKEEIPEIKKFRQDFNKSAWKSVNFSSISKIPMKNLRNFEQEVRLLWRNAQGFSRRTAIPRMQ